MTGCPEWHNSVVFISWIEENISLRPEQRYPSGCLSTCSTGKITTRISFFELHFRRSELDMSGSRRSPEAQGLVFGRPVHRLGESSAQRSPGRWKCHRSGARGSPISAGRRVCDQLISAAEISGAARNSLDTASQLHSPPQTGQKEMSHGFTALRRRHHGHGAAQHREQPALRPDRSRRGHDQHLGDLS